MDHEAALIETSRMQRAVFGPPKMSIFEATMIAEGCWDVAGYEPSDETATEAWQLLIDTGTCWRLQGWFGRQAVALIEAGVCTR